MLWAPLVAQWIENLNLTQETWVHSLGRENPLEKGMVTHSSILACRILWTEEPGRLHGVAKESNMTWRLNNSEKCMVIWVFGKLFTSLNLNFPIYITQMMIMSTSPGC